MAGRQTGRQKQDCGNRGTGLSGTPAAAASSASNIPFSGKIPAHPLPGSTQRRTWRYLLSELRTWMLDKDTYER
jgi:hypothetical protein